jgi:hypothetical protein
MYEPTNTGNLYRINTNNSGEINTLYNIAINRNMLRLLVLFVQNPAYIQL